MKKTYLKMLFTSLCSMLLLTLIPILVFPQIKSPELDARKAMQALDEASFPYRFKFFVYGQNLDKANGIAGKGDWTDKKLQPYLYHVRRNGWKGYFLQVNSSRRTVHKVTEGKFGEIGGNKELTNIIVIRRFHLNNPYVDNGEPLTGRFGLLFPSTYLIHYVTAGKTDIKNNVGAVITPKGGDYNTEPYTLVSNWDLKVVRLKPYLFRLSTKVDTGLVGTIRWEVNTSRKKVLVEREKSGKLIQEVNNDLAVNVSGDPNNPDVFL